MKILVNLGTLKAGGGQNVALNFLMAQKEMCLPDISFHYFVADHSDVYKYLRKQKYENYTVVSANPIIRTFQEMTALRKVIRRFNPDVIYSYFGFGFFSRRIPQVSGSADSNLYFPEVDFWKDERELKKIKRWLIDKYRLFGLNRCQGVVYENSLMEARARSLLGLKNTAYIRPSLVPPEVMVEFNIIPSDTKKIKLLFLCGWQRNKQVMLIPGIADALRKRKLPFCIYLTAPADGSSEHQQFDHLLRELGVQDCVRLVGVVSKELLPSLFSKIDYVMLLSKLESFSNNILEAWYFKRCLVIANEPWAKSICGNAALYVDRDNVEDIVTAVSALENDVSRKLRLVAEGASKLKEYPSGSERIAQELEFLRSVCEAN